MYTLAHLSDPHLAPLASPGLAALLSKRVLGYLSWKARRQGIHQRRMLDALVADLHEKRPSHVVITGDLVNISLPSEFAAAAAWLRSLGDADWITVIPGNHDTYVKLPWENSLALWAEYMSSEWTDAPDRPKPPTSFADFPIVRRRGPLALVGLSTAHPTAPFSAVGWLGQRQLEKLERCLEALGRMGLFRVVLMHHPPLAKQARRTKRLIDAPAFRAAVARAGAELILHGHVHAFSSGRIAHPAGAAAVLGVPSASAVHVPGRCLSHYHLYTFTRAGPGWHVGVAVRGWDESAQGFTPKGEYSLGIIGAASSEGARSASAPARSPTFGSSA